MAKHNIKMVCGHVEEHQIYGPMDGRPAQATAISYRQCHDCNVQDNLQRGARSATANAAAGLPILTGTVPQIAWAETIREKALAEDAEWLASILDIARKSVAAGKGTQEDYDLAAAQMNAGFAALRGETESGYWIDNRKYRNGYRVKLKASELSQV